MGPIIRTPTRAEGGITAVERGQMDRIAREWTEVAFRSAPADPERVRDAVTRLYAAAGLPAPRVVVVPSPVVMAFAYGAAAWIWHCRKGKATVKATRAVTDAATDAATVWAADAATRAVTDAADACRDLAGAGGLRCAAMWSRAYQGGAFWPAFPAFVAACRDVLGLGAVIPAGWQAWEDCAREGTFRLLHPEFCLVCDFPSQRITVDAQNRPHNATGPTHLWRDGTAWYHWHGVRVPGHWIERPGEVDPAEVIRAENVEQRAAGAAIVGWRRMAPKLQRRIIDGDPESDFGALIELTLPGLPEPGRFLQARCPRNGSICEGLPRVSDIDGLPIDTVIAAQAWRVGDPASDYDHPPLRT